MYRAIVFIVIVVPNLLLGQTELVGGEFIGNEDEGFVYKMKCQEDSLEYYQVDHLVIKGKPVLIKKYDLLGLYAILPKNVLYSSIDQTDSNKYCFIYGRQSLIEGHNTYFLHLRYRATARTSIMRVIPFGYYELNGATNISEFEIQSCELEGKQSGTRFTVSEDAMKPTKLEKRILRWKKWHKVD